MGSIFIKIFNMSMGASWLILAIIAARLLLKRAPKRIVCLLWALAALKLVIPFSPESIFSLIPSAEVIPENITTQMHPKIDSGIVYVNSVVNPVMEAGLSPQPGDSVNPLQVIVQFAGIIWCAGMVICLIYALVSYLVIRKKVSASVKLDKNVYACDEVSSPFILGVFRPVIYVPSGLDSEALEYVLAHENAHLRRGDHFWKPLGFIILSVYWFNPLCWVAYILLSRDIEYACDEKVIRDRDELYITSYSQTLLDLGTRRKVITVCPLAFGETGVGSRIKGILNYRKPAFWIIIVSIAVCIILAVCFLTRPEKEDPEEGDPAVTEVYDMTKPPELMVTYCGDTHKAMQGTYSWHYPDKNGMIAGEAADSIHPLYISDLRPSFYLSPYEDEIKLDFAAEPDEVYIRCWDEKYATKGEIDESDFSVPVYSSDTHSFVFPNKTGVVIEVTAVWKTGNGITDNTASYSFTVKKLYAPVSEPAAVTGQDAGSFAESIGLCMSVINVTPTECDVVFSQNGADVKWELTTESAFDIQRMNGNGMWEEVPFIPTEYPVVWNDMAYLISENDDTVIHTRWDYLYGELFTGYYRIHKRVYDFGGPEGSDVYDLYAEFSAPASKEEEEALLAGDFVIMENGSVVAGKDKWSDFYEKTLSGSSAAVRLAYVYTSDKSDGSSGVYETAEDEYPNIFVSELVYDGSGFVIGPLHYDGSGFVSSYVSGYDNPVTGWKYLMHYTGTPRSQTALFTEYDRYVLVNDDSVSWEDLEMGMVSSRFGDIIPFTEVFCEYTWK